jgi:chaperonin GroEL
MVVKESINKLVQDRDVLAGAGVVLKACLEPVRRIAQNSGKSPDVIEEEMNRNLPKGLGYDASKNQFVDLVANGIIDPVKVTKMALKNSSSVAKLFLNLDAIVVNGDLS